MLRRHALGLTAAGLFAPSVLRAQARLAIAAFLTAASLLSALPASAVEAPPASALFSWRPVGHGYAHITLPDGASSAVHDGPALPVVFVLPDEGWDARRMWPYLDHLSLFGLTVVELWPDDDRRFGLEEARAAIASAAEEFGLDPSRVALLGFGKGGRLALALAGPDRPVAALYPVCDGALGPDQGARVMVLHPDEASETQACAALVAGRPGARSGSASAGAGHGWDAVIERNSGRILLPRPDGSNTGAGRLPAHPDRFATFRAARAVSDFLLND